MRVYTALLALVYAVDIAGAQPAPAPAPTPTPTPAPPPATEPPAESPTPAPVTAPAPEPEPTPEKLFDTKIYGYINSYWEQASFTEHPLGYDRTAMAPIEDREANEFDVLNLNVMIQGTVGDRYKYFLNIAAPGAGGVIDDEPIGVRNAWLEASLVGNYLAIRGGKLYRRFGLYNEILDAVPTFIGIEPPEILDKDHLMITRTTNLMLHGTYVAGDNELQYAVTTGNDEREGAQVPIGLDVNLQHKQQVKVGVSYYDSMGKAVPGVAVGDGSPKGGVANWMAVDKYRVIDAYFQLTRGSLIAQLEYCRAMHKGQRDPASLLALAADDSNLSPAQWRRFFSTPFGAPGTMENDVNVTANYTVQTAYVRLGYELEVGSGTLTPYVQGDYYKNPEIVGEKSFGGDNEAGWDDGGQFIKTTIGFVYRPIYPVALKTDVSTHTQKFDGASYTYPELRVSAAYFWEL